MPNRADHRSPRRLASARPRRRRAARGRAAQRAPVRPRHRHAEPAPAGRHGRAGARLPRSRPRRGARGRRLRAADDALPHRHDAARPRCGARARPASSRSSSIPAGATTNSDAGVTDLRKVARDARRRREGRHRPARPRRGHRSGRSTCSIARRSSSSATWSPLRRDFPGLRIVLEHVTTKEGAQYVAEAGPHDGGDDHRAPPALQPQRDLHRRHPAALLLPAGAEARGASARARRRGDVGQRALLPRHRQRAASCRAEGARERLRRLLHRVQRARAVRRGVRGRRRARPPRAVREPRRPGLLRPGAQRRRR